MTTQLVAGAHRVIAEVKVVIAQGGLHFGAATDPPPTPGPDPAGGVGGFDFEVNPTNGGFEQADVPKTIAGLIAYIGLGLAVLAALLGIITWFIGSKIGGRQMTDEGKQTFFRALAGAFLIGALGAIFRWVVLV